MPIVQAIGLGIVQGLTEFIPVSSSGHLQLVPQVLGWAQPTTTFILFLHLGTLLALVLYFRNLLWKYIKVCILWLRNGRKLEFKEDRRNWEVAKRILLATIPAAILGAVFDKYIERFYDGAGGSIPTLLTVMAMAIFGVVFLFADKFFTGKKTDLDRLGWGRVLAVGFSQAIAFVRGISRSGITLISGQAVGLTRVEAAEFSFLISIPIIAGTSVLAVYDTLKQPAETVQAELLPALLGMLAAFVFGYIAIRFLLNYLKHKGLALFGWYRIIFAILCLILLS